MSVPSPSPDRRGRLSYIGFALIIVAVVGCARTPAAPQGSSEPVAQQQHELTALEYFQGKKNWACEAGKEHWRAQGAPKRGGAFVQALTGLVHIDPSAAGGNSHYQPQVYEHLVETRACYYEDTVFVPGLAESWQVSGDGMTYTIKLRQDVKWHASTGAANRVEGLNGRKFTSADVAWTIEHQKVGGQLRSAWQPVKYTTPDDSTIVMTLPEPQADFLGNVLGERTDYMLPREVKEQYGDFKNHAVGTGPFMMKEFVPQQRVTEVRNPDYRGMGSDGKALPYIDEVNLPVFGDYSAEVAAMRAGQVDLNSVTGYLKPDSDAIQGARPNYKYYRDVAPIPRGLFMLLDKKPFHDVRVRKGLGLAINHEDIIDAGYQGGALRTGFIPTAIVDYSWPLDKVRGSLKQDQEQAKRLLAEAGYGPNNPLKFTLKTGPNPQDRGGAEVVQNQFQQIGVDAQIELSSNPLVAQDIALKNYVIAWGGISPASIFADRWVGGFLRCGDSRNYTNLCDPEVDRLSQAQGKESDPVKRKVVLDQLQDRLYNLMPWTPTLSLIYYRVYSCRVKNMPSTEWTQQLTGIANAWLDPAGC